MSITNSECVSVALIIQHVMRMRHIVIGDLPALPYVSILSHKPHKFEKKFLNIKCVLISPITFVWNISHCKRNWSSCKIPFILFRF